MVDKLKNPAKETTGSARGSSKGKIDGISFKRFCQTLFHAGLITDQVAAVAKLVWTDAVQDGKSITPEGKGVSIVDAKSPTGSKTTHRSVIKQWRKGGVNGCNDNGKPYPANWNELGSNLEERVKKALVKLNIS